MKNLLWFISLFDWKHCSFVFSVSKMKRSTFPFRQTQSKEPLPFIKCFHFFLYNMKAHLIHCFWQTFFFPDGFVVLRDNRASPPTNPATACKPEGIRAQELSPYLTLHRILLSGRKPVHPPPFTCGLPPCRRWEMDWSRWPSWQVFFLLLSIHHLH